jgi:hypothetical protein
VKDNRKGSRGIPELVNEELAGYEQVHEDCSLQSLPDLEDKEVLRLGQGEGVPDD